MPATTYLRNLIARHMAIRKIKRIGAIGLSDTLQTEFWMTPKLVETIVIADFQGNPRELACLSEFPELRNLGIIDSRVGDEIVPHLRRMTCLYQLNLFGSRLTDEGLDALTEIASLRCLIVSNTCVSEEGICQFKSARSDCELWSEKVEVDVDLLSLWRRG